MIQKRVLDRPPEELPVTKKNKHANIPASDEVVDLICSKWGIKKEEYAWWQRGKRVNVSTHAVKSKIFDPVVYNSKGDYWPANNFHPLRVIHVGQPAFSDNKGEWRIKQEALELMRSSIDSNVFEVDISSIASLLEGEIPTVEDFEVELPRGSCMIKSGDYLVPVWVAARVSPMIDDKEQEIIRIKLGR